MRSDLLAYYAPHINSGGMSREDQIKAYKKDHSKATNKAVAKALGCTPATVAKYTDTPWEYASRNYNKQIFDYRDDHPHASVTEIAKATRINRNTVTRHLKAGWIEYGRTFLGLDKAAEIDEIVKAAIQEDRKKRGSFAATPFPFGYLAFLTLLDERALMYSALKSTYSLPYTSSRISSAAKSK